MIRTLAALIPAVIALGACSSTPPPSVAQARTAIDEARRDGAAQFAPQDLHTAQQRLSGAQAAVEGNWTEEASLLAREATVTARAADAKTDAAKAKQGLTELEAGVAELERQRGIAPMSSVPLQPRLGQAPASRPLTSQQQTAQQQLTAAAQRQWTDSNSAPDRLADWVPERQVSTPLTPPLLSNQPLTSAPPAQMGAVMPAPQMVPQSAIPPQTSMVPYAQQQGTAVIILPVPQAQQYGLVPQQIPGTVR